MSYFCHVNATWRTRNAFSRCKASSNRLNTGLANRGLGEVWRNEQSKGIEPKYGREQYRQKLLPKYLTDPDGDEYDTHQEIRDKFLKALGEFATCLKVALASTGFFIDISVGEEKITRKISKGTSAGIC